MEPTGVVRKRPRIFYGWWIVLGGFVISALGGGLIFYGFGVFFVPLNEEFGWSRAALAGVFAFSQIEGGILGPIEGLLVDKLGPRKIMLVGIPMMALGFVLLSQVNSLLMLYVVYIGGIALGNALGSLTPVTAAIANWFSRKRGRAFGIVNSGTAVGGGILLPVLGWWIATFGWRHTFVAAGVLTLAVGVPIALLVRHRPEPYGYLPDGAEPTSARGASEAVGEVTEVPQSSVEASEFDPIQSLKTWAFWFLGIAVALRTVVTSGVSIHFVAMMVDRGFSMTVASSLLGAVVFLTLIGRLGLAWLGDLVDKRSLFAATMGVIALMMIGMSQAQSVWLIGIILVVYAVAYGGAIIIPFPLQADYFGRNYYATIRGLLHTVQAGGMVVGPVFAGLVYDLTQSYVVAFFGFAGAAALAAILLAAMRKPVARG